MRVTAFCLITVIAVLQGYRDFKILWRKER